MIICKVVGKPIGNGRNSTYYVVPIDKRYIMYFRKSSIIGVTNAVSFTIALREENEICTSRGWVPIRELKIGDELVTLDHDGKKEEKEEIVII